MKTLKLLFAVVVVALLFSECTYDFIVPEEIIVIDPDDPDAEQISFSTAIAPIFASKCASCHKTGGQLPDLTAGNAFSAINSTRYISSTSPTESKIYAKANPASGGSHPKYSEAEAALVLAWIQQGAKNN